MGLGQVSTLYLSWKIIISPYLFKRVADDLGRSPLIIQVAQMLKSISSTPIPLPYIIKAIYMELSLYL